MSAASKPGSVLSVLDVALESEAEFLLFDYLEIRGHLRSLVDVAKASSALAEECFERMAAADLEAWDAPYRIEYPGLQVDAVRDALRPLAAPK